MSKLVPTHHQNKYNYRYTLQTTEDLVDMFKEYINQKSPSCLNEPEEHIENYNTRITFIRRVIHPTFMRSYRILNDLDWNQVDKHALNLYLFECFVVNKVKLF